MRFGPHSLSGLAVGFDKIVGGYGALGGAHDPLDLVAARPAGAVDIAGENRGGDLDFRCEGDLCPPLPNEPVLKLHGESLP